MRIFGFVFSILFFAIFVVLFECCNCIIFTLLTYYWTSTSKLSSVTKFPFFFRNYSFIALADKLTFQSHKADDKRTVFKKKERNVFRYSCWCLSRHLGKSCKCTFSKCYNLKKNKKNSIEIIFFQAQCAAPLTKQKYFCKWDIYHKPGNIEKQTLQLSPSVMSACTTPICNITKVGQKHKGTEAQVPVFFSSREKKQQNLAHTPSLNLPLTLEPPTTLPLTLSQQKK